MSTNSYTIHDDVLLSESKVAFLIGGNHSVLDYITGKKQPTAASLQNFKNNISSRSYIAKLCHCKYLHVIFPDKQSVLQSEFPIKNTVRLGDIYNKTLSDSPVRDSLLYPTAKLETSGRFDCYQQLDTHLSDYGSFLVLEEILSKLGENADNALQDLKSQIIVKKKTTGDLGGKFNPKLVQESTHLRTNWNHRHFSSGGTFNNGQIDLYLSPDAPIKKKILIFGDSFYRLMLRHFSKVFSEIVFLRTPYLHAEMVQLIKPDIILTGNAERYLADVTSDVNAPAFQIFSYAHHSQVKPTPLFVHAFKAVTSPTAKSSKIFFEQIFHDRSQPKIIAGPSHVVRWAHQLKHGDLDRPASLSDLVGYGGAPVWSKKLFDMVEQDHQPHTKTLLMVGDFRFGNEICLKSNRETLPLFLSGLSGINAHAINPANDSFMLKKCINALESWNTKFNNNIRFIFWDLLCRQVQDRLAGRHISNRKYQHPNWNLGSLQTLLPSNRVIDLTPLLSLPMHEAMRLFIDGSSHPSLIGYKFIINCFVFESDAITAYNKAIDEIETEIFSLIENIIRQRQNKITICGRSVWIDTFMRYLGPSGLNRANRMGLFIMPFNSQIGHKTADNTEISGKHTSEIFFISENGCLSDLIAEDLKIIASTNISLSDATKISWEASCSSVISARNETPRTLYGPLSPKRSEAKTLDITDADIELGPFGYPTMRGLMKLLASI